MNDTQREEISKLIQEGYVEGKDIIDGEIVTWKLLVEVEALEAETPLEN